MEFDQDKLSENSGDFLFGEDYDTARASDGRGTVKRLWKTIKSEKRRLTVVSVSVVMYTVLTIAAPYYSAGVVDLLWENIKACRRIGEAFSVTWHNGGFEIFILFLLYLGAWAFNTLQSYLMISFAERLNLRLRTEMSKKLNILPLSYFDRNKVGAVLSHFTNDLDKMSEALQTGVLRLFTSFGMIVGSVVLMFCFNRVMTFIFLGFLILSVVVTGAFSNATLKSAQNRQQCMSVVTGLVEEGYSGRTVIKAFNREEKNAADIHKATDDLARAAEKADFMMNSINPVIRMVNRTGQMFIALYAGWLLIQGRMTVGVFQAFFQYVNQAAEPLTEASYVVNSMHSALASAERVYQLLDEVEMTAEPEEPLTVQQAEGHVEFRNVRFGYTPEKILMRDISFKAEPGQKIAIVGATGAGKTTLINLLMRFYDVNGGSVVLDGIDTAGMTRKNLRENLGMVLQDTWLFEGTIAENIAYGKPEAGSDEIIAAAKVAKADYFIRTMSSGYDTVISNDGENLSAGQRQLLTIARMVLRDPAVLILDEATSSVDTRTELEINKAMWALMQKRTSFVIAHRLSTVVDADLILVMADGDIIEQGSHQELLEKGGAYAEIYNSQFDHQSGGAGAE